jgi:hypothetical protein
MKSKTRIVSIALSISAFMIFVSCQKQKAEWKGTIEEIDGVKVIINPEEPLYDEVELELELDLSIGGEDVDEKYSFIRAADIEVDKEGNIFILDFRPCRIQKYDKNGNYLKTIGREGQGPGEWERALAMSLDTKGRIHVKERGEIHIFDKNGEYIKSMKADYQISSDIMSNGGNLLFCTGPIYSEEGVSLDVILLDSDGKKVDTIASFPDPTVVLRKSASGGRRDTIMGFPPPYSPGLYFCSLSERLGIYGYSSEYKLCVVNSSGETVYRIEKDEKRQPTSKKEEGEFLEKRVEIHKEAWKDRGGFPFSKRELRKIYNFAKYKPFFTGIITDDSGHIFLQKPKSILHKEIDTFFDLFSQEGYYLYKVKIPEINPHIIKMGYIYTLRYNPDTGYYKVERFKIKNWEQIKEGL